MKLKLEKANVRYAAALLGAVAVLLWAGWITSEVSQPKQNQFARVQLQSLISEYVSKQARSASSPEVIGKQTKAFMGALDQTVSDYGKNGTVLLVNEAIVGSNLPDVTADIRTRVYQVVAEPKAMRSKESVEQQMSSFFGGTGQ